MGNLKFGVFLPFYAFQTQNPKPYYEQLKKIVLTCEQLGYDSVWIDDHLMYNNAQILECWTTLAALAASTQRIRLGTMVTCNAHRNPALLAKEAATLDVISEGRLEFGVGAGVQEAEHTAYGFDFAKPSVRVAQLDEALDVITRLWTESKANYSGRYYTLKDAVCEPKPKQKPHPPITVGGAGEKHTLKVTAKHADRFDWGFIPSVEDYTRKLAVLERHCRTVGRDFWAIERSCWPSGQIIVAADQKALDERVAKYKPAGTSLEAFKKYTLVGTVDECEAALGVYVDLGVTHFMLYFADLPSTDGIELFSRAVAKLG
ncbi:MAG: TIGR03560 family F420-dependent LLM class oxidoreductase [Candidatus Bathyarchaeota archaeon]|nr:TIGR03560 family F420-dependent LLM class oxidoreductase [Candidatus Bathyarchaeota archaeon]